MRNVLPEGGGRAASPTAVMAPNKDLNGHKLLLITSSDPPPGYLEHLHEKYPGLQVVRSRHSGWEKSAALSDVSDEDWATVTILLTGMTLPTPDQAPKLQLVQLQSAGADYVLDNPLFKDTDIAFCTANGIHGPQISEWVICTYLAFQHHIPHFLDNMRDHKWERHHDSVTLDCVRQRVGILGYGSIGRQVARVATAMGMEVYAYTQRARDTPASRRDASYHPPGLGDPEGTLPTRWFSGSAPGAFLASGLDLLVVALPLTPQTAGFLGEAQFRALDAGARATGRRAYVANVGRGPVVATAALVRALDAGWIRGAALDVTDPEPLPREHPLWRKPNVIVTPHVSGASDKYHERLLDVLDINLGRLSGGEDFMNRVSRKRGY
ncbi:D-isomer specific 2-hydroxyacid dehydrogenase [Xylariomycetidae sp. FL0641]|nr:D-isomer specific 2-hydroxyacid dehydrogenase [Xylariomycetidae sp. FL0641]